MNEQIRDILQEKALDFAESIGAPIEFDEDHSYIHAATMYRYLGFNKSNTSGPARDYEDLAKKLKRGHWYIRADFIFWHLMRISGGHNQSYKVVERIRGVLQEEFGIPTPKRQWYLYFYEVKATLNIKVGITANYKSGRRTSLLKKKYGEGRYLGALKDATDTEEENFQKTFAHLCVNKTVDEELFHPGEKLLGYIEAAKKSDRWTPEKN